MIRDATSSDIEAIEALIKSVAGLWDKTWRTDVLERALGSCSTIALVHQDGPTIKAFLCAHDLGFRGYLSELVVAPAFQRQGLGSELLCALERRLAERGCSVIIADVWRDAEDFYRSKGWTPPPVVLLRKQLQVAAAQLGAAADQPQAAGR